MGILSFLTGCGGLGPKGDNGIGKKAKDNESGISGFRYSYNGSIGANSFSYEIKDEDGKKVFIYEAMEHSEFEDMKTECPSEVLEQLYQIYLDLRVAEWDGFSKYNPHVLDGDGFSLHIDFNDGAKLSASGSNASPERYGEFEKKMNEVLYPLAEGILKAKRKELIDRGINGHLTSLMFIFKQQGTSGSNYYHVMLRRDEKFEKNLEAEVKTKGEEGIFPAGEYHEYYTSPFSESNLEVLEQAIKDYEIIKWYDFNEHTEDPNNSEWFQISFCYGDDDLYINAYGTKKPEHYEEFRTVCLRWLDELIVKVTEKNAEAE